MSKLETIQVYDAKGNEMVINLRDYDPSVHFKSKPGKKRAKPTETDS